MASWMSTLMEKTKQAGTSVKDGFWATVASKKPEPVEKSGIFPLNPEVIDDLVVMPARSFSKSAVSSSAGAFVQDTDDGLDTAWTFLQSRVGEVLRNVQTYKPRNTISKIVGGKVITDETVVDRIVERKKQHPEKRKSDKEVGKEKKKSSVITSLPSSSRLSKGNFAQHKSKGKGLSRKKRIDNGPINKQVT